MLDFTVQPMPGPGTHPKFCSTFPQHNPSTHDR